MSTGSNNDKVFDPFAVITKELWDQIEHGEGTRYFPYTDTVGKLTIGVGRNLSDVGLSPDEVAYLFTNDIKRAIRGLDQEIAWWRELDDVRQRVLIDMCFNLGISRLLGFRNTLALIKEGKYKEASSQMLRSKWAKQVKGRALRLSRMMEEG